MRIGRKRLGGFVAGWVWTAVLCGVFGSVTCHADSPADSPKDPTDSAKDTGSNRAPEVEATLGGPGRLTRIDLVDFRGRSWRIDDFADARIVVVAFLGTECPLAKLYSVRLRELQETYRGRGVRVVGVMSNRQDSLEEIAAFATRQNLSFPVLKDAGNRLADDIGATRTPQVFVFDQDRRLRYRGRVDDQYGIGYIRDSANREDLRVALDELLAGRPVSVPRADAVGCIIGRQKTPDAESEVTFGGQVAEILARQCVECHREGEIAPFALTDYDEVAGWADMIAETVTDGRMPPWHAAPGHTLFGNDRGMSSEEKEILVRWAEAGAPAGDLSDLPTAPEKVAGWQLPREPDLVVPVSPEPFEVPASGSVRYQYFRFDPGFDREMWVESMELRPGNREVVHHILAFTRPKGSQGGLDGARGFLAGYVPGARLEATPKGHAKRIPADSELIFQVHYTPIGTTQQDQSRFGLVFTDPESVTHEIVTTSALQTRFEIPPGASNHEVLAEGPRFPADAKLLSMSPHMHVRGKAFRYELQTPDGERTTLLDVPAYDFNWQTTYTLAEPLPIEPESRIVCRAWYDNSEANLHNPDPTKAVRWGDQTWDEMMIGYYHYAVPVEVTADDPAAKTSLGSQVRDTRRSRVRQSATLRIFERLDRDGDGKLDRADVPDRMHAKFDELDRNDDGVLTREEVRAADG